MKNPAVRVVLFVDSRQGKHNGMVIPTKNRISDLQAWLLVQNSKRWILKKATWHCVLRTPGKGKDAKVCWPPAKADESK
jgi:hypothetical protein